MLDLIISVLTRTIIAGTPLLLATLGEILAERAGILNLGIEGLMSAGAVTAFIITFNTGSPWLGLFCAILVGALIASIHGFICISLRANQVVSGPCHNPSWSGGKRPVGKTIYWPSLTQQNAPC